MRRFDTVFDNIQVGRVTYDFPNIIANSTVISDETLTGVALGTHIISWAPASDATAIDDLLIQFLVIATNTLRVTLTNPTGGAIDPGSIDLEFVFSTVNPLIDP